MPKPRSALSKFILQQPRDVPVAQVIKRAKAKGMKVTKNNVYRVRRLYGAGKPKPNATTGTALSKSAFIRDQPRNMPAKDVVAKGKAAGLTLTAKYVYETRTDMNKGAKKTGPAIVKAATRRTAPRQAPAVTRPIGSTSSAEDLLKAVAAEIGLGQAVEILQAERARVRAAIGG